MKERVEKIRNQIGPISFYQSVADSRGWNDGLTIVWKSTMKVELDTSTKRHIFIKVIENERGEEWIITCFYGNPINTKRTKKWHLLRELKPSNNRVLLCMGGLLIRFFNDMRNMVELSDLILK